METSFSLLVITSHLGRRPFSFRFSLVLFFSFFFSFGGWVVFFLSTADADVDC